jgi:hypothetical protein
MLVKFHHACAAYFRVVPLDIVKEFASLNGININSTFKLSNIP